MLRFVPTLVFLFVVTGPLFGANWPQWRGPLGTGVSPDKDLPLQWNSGDAKWTATLSGQGVSSPIVFDDRIYITSQRGRGVRRPGDHPTLARGDEAAYERGLLGAEEGEKVEFLVEAFSLSDGSRLWEFRLDAVGDLHPVHQKHNLASSSPVADDDGVFALFGTGQLVALTPDGKLRWQRHLGTENGPFVINWGHASSPALEGNTLFLICYHDASSYLLAVDTQNGEDRWKVDRGPGVTSYSTPVIVPGPSGRELIVNSSERLDAYDPSTGKHLWYTGEANRFPIPVPSFHDGIIYASRGYRSGPYMAIEPGGRGDISKTHVKWKVESGAPYVSSLLHYDGLIYMANDAGVVTCVDAKTGERVWQERIGGIFSASPIAGDGKIYFMSETGETIVFRAGREPQVLAKNQIEGRILASPAIANRQIVIRTDGTLVCVDNK